MDCPLPRHRHPAAARPDPPGTQGRAEPHENKAAVSQGLAPRKGRAYRDLFALVRTTLGGAAHAGDEAEAPDEDEPND